MTPEVRIEDSRNVVAGGTISADGNVHIGDKIVTNVYYSAQYQELAKNRKDAEEQFQSAMCSVKEYPDNGRFRGELLRADNKRQEIQQQLDELKKEVIRLAEDFTKIPINTERLRVAKQLFESGDYPAARAILNAEEMGSELDALLRQEERLQRLRDENQANLLDKAHEFLILARLTAIDRELPNRFAKAREYYEQSLKAAQTLENTFAYAHFLQQHNQFGAAAGWYTTNLTLYRALAAAHPEAYLPNVAGTAANLAMFYQRELPDQEQSLAYAALALLSALPFVASVPVVRRYVGQALQVAEAWGVGREEFFNQVVQNVPEG